MTEKSGLLLYGANGYTGKLILDVALREGLLDFSARYELVKGLEVYFDASNLLNNAGRRYSNPSNLLGALGIPTKRDGRYTIESETFGRRFSGGVRFTF